MRSESDATSRIANLTASAKAIALAELGDPTKHNAGTIVANTRAMQAALALADDLDEQAILDMHEVLTRLADLLVRQPVVDSALVQRELGVAATNANTAIDHLEAKGIVTKVSGNYRNREWAASEVLAALDEVAERAGRRSRSSYVP